jgi:2-methylcitrate dehydratase PrpD
MKVRAELAIEMPTGAASVTVTTCDGRRETVHVRHARGSPKNPLSDKELEAKFRDSAAQSAASNSKRIRRVWTLNSAEDLAALMALMAEQ